VSYRKATEINPEFSLAYNLLGYAYRSAGLFDQAEAAFKRYIELIPDEPNPYDSYAEFLMKTGRFEESIVNYEKALTLDEQFVPSYVGIANNLMFLGRTDEAREILDRLLEVGRNDGERRQALFWTAASHLHDGDHEAANETVRRMLTIAEAAGDWAQVAGDHAMMGTILLERGEPGEALGELDESLAALERAEVNDDIKEGFRRNHLYRKARAALEQDDLEGARQLTEAFAEAVASRNIPAEVRRVHELQGRIAFRQSDFAEAVSHFEQANQQDPQILYRLSLASRGAGEIGKARDYADKAANWNQLGINYGLVRTDALRLLAELEQDVAGS
jgi:tetratricopeptide (TPR) repeat protein